MADPRTERSGLAWTFPDSGSGRLRTVDFTPETTLLGDDARTLVDAAWVICENAQPNTIRNCVYTIRRLVGVLAATSSRSGVVQEWATLYETALRDDPTITEGTRWTYFNTGSQIMAGVARTRDESFRGRNPFTSKSVSSEPLLHGDELAPLLAQARLDAMTTVNAIKAPPSTHQPFIAEARELLEVGTLVGYCNAKIGIRSKDRGDALARRWYKATELPLELLTIHVYPTPLQLLPFYVLLSFALASNPDSLSLLKQSEISDALHPMKGPIIQLDMKKPRAGEIPQRFIRDAGTLSEGWLLRHVIKFSESIVHLADESDKEYVFLCTSRNMKGRANAFRGGLRSKAMNSYLKIHDLPAITTKQLRAARLTDEWVRTRDPLRVWRLSGNASMAMAAEYVLNAESAAADAKSLADIQKTIASPPKAVKPEGKSARAGTSTHICLNVFEPSQPKDKHGFCASYLWPFNDVHFILPLEPRPVAYLLRDYAVLCEAEKSIAPDRFEKLYAAKKRLIETEYLPLVDDQLMAKAEAIAAMLPPSSALIETM